MCLTDYVAIEADIAQKYKDSKLFLPRTIAFVYSNETQSRGCHDAWLKFACLKRFPRCNPTTLEVANICKSVCQSYLDQCWWKLTYQSYFYTYRKENGERFCVENSEKDATKTFCSDASTIAMNLVGFLILLINLV